MPHAKTDSEVTSLAPSSPPRSPPRTRGSVYYVQSPSHDGKTATSVHSTPALSPTASPRHSHSSSSRFSGHGHHHKRKGDRKGWQEIGAIEEEGDDEEHTRIVPRKCYCFLVFLLGFVALFSFFALVLWAASRSQKPHVGMKRVRFHSFIVQAGTDASLVPTDMATTNATVDLTYRNRGHLLRHPRRRRPVPARLHPAHARVGRREGVLPGSQQQPHGQRRRGREQGAAVRRRAHADDGANLARQGVPLRLLVTKVLNAGNNTIDPPSTSQLYCNEGVLFVFSSLLLLRFVDHHNNTLHI